MTHTATQTTQSPALWYALRTRSRCEKLVLHQLQQKGIACYLPLLRQTRRYTRKVRVTEQPMIRGYVFTCIRPAEMIPALDTLHAAGFVQFEGRAAAIPEADIQLIRRIAGEAEKVLPEEKSSLEAGQAVEVIGGALTGLQGQVVARKGKYVLLIRLDYLDCSLAIDIDQRYLRTI